MKALLDRWFGVAEEINGNERCPTYLYRWELWEPTRWEFKVYLHHFVGEDWSYDLHDHPKRFITIGLWGSYIETTMAKGVSPYHTSGRRRFKKWRAPWVRSFPARYAHRLSARNCWTICIVLKKERPWGFYSEGAWWPFRNYIDSPNADRYKSCPD